MLRTPWLLAFVTVCALAPVLSAQAQQSTTLPGYTVIDIGALDLNKEVKKEPTPKEAFSSIGNTQMRSILELQNQITMINALTSWQSQVTKMEETYMRAGMPFTPPPPPRGLCEQVPPNRVCSDAYSDMEAPQEAIPGIKTASLDKGAMGGKKSSKAGATAETITPAAMYEWADIRCMANACRATIVDISSGMRLTGTEGENIADGVMIQRITPTGVRLTVDGVGTDLRASDKPSLPAMVTNAPAPTGGLQGLLNDTPGGEAAAIEAKAASQNDAEPAPLVIDDGSNAPGGSNASGDGSLGATGLF